MTTFPHYSAAELTSCQLLNDLTAATLQLGLLRRSGLTLSQHVHVVALAHRLEVAVATVTAAHVDAVLEAIPAPRPSTRHPLHPPALHFPLPSRDYDNHADR